jgi:serine/threonine protein kinase/tetratricopeptide (TPR) repeat protein
MTIPLGQFDLSSRVARGGMGEIWRGVHRAQNVPVAVKLVTEAASTSERFYDDFRREVQAAARLTHPHVAMVFEYGAVPPAASLASDHELVAGSPYLVMEWASRGSLDDLERPLSWRELRGVLLTLLDALGHAHARGVIHRDLKPGNVLVADDGPIERAIRLSDFGVARAQDREGEDRRTYERETSALTEAPAGTPHYMAPEQVYGRFRDYGPWTDLYALGILAWELACGAMPFEGATMIALLYKQLEEPLPPLRARIPVPTGFEAWLQRLTAKRPRDRFRYAADAAWALSSLGEPPAIASTLPPRAPSAAEPAAEAFDATIPSLPSITSLAVAPPPVRPALELAVQPDDDERVPPQPAHWGSTLHALPPMRLVGAGLGLWALRSIAMVDRARERDALWEQLRAVRIDRSPRAIVLRGAAGCGKSRLAQWLVERAQEVGAAETMTTSHQVVPDRRHGLARLVEKHHRSSGLGVEGVLARFEEQLRADGVEDPFEWRALAGIVIGEGPEATRASIPPTTPGERNVLLSRLLARASRERPVIVWLDDAQWGEDSLALVQHVLATSGAPPVLFVITLRDENLVDRPRERALLASIEVDPRVETLRVGGLGASDVRVLCERELGLNEDLATMLEARVDGHPLFALQIVGDWIGRGLLDVGAEGFVLRQGARTEIPDDLHGVWLDRVRKVLEGRGPNALGLIELAAVLGVEVDAEEFGLACEALGASFPGDLLEPLILHRLILPSESGWSFVHNLLRESLIRSARETGRLPALHRACVTMLEQIADRRGIAERIAHHLLAIGDRERALGPLARAAKARLDRSEIDASLALLDEHDAARAALGIPDTDPRALDAAIARAEALRTNWDFDGAERIALAALDGATRASAYRERAQALTILAHCARQRGDLALAMTRNRTAFGLYERVDDAQGRARSLLAMAIIARQQGERERSLELYGRAEAMFASLGDELGRASALLGLGNLHRTAQRLDDAKAKYTLARDMFERLGNQGNLAHCVNGLAEIARYEGDLDVAEDGYREVLRIQTAIGSKATFIPRMNLGLVLLTRRDFASARAELETVLAQLERGGQRGYLGWTRSLLLPCAAAARDTAAFDAHLASATALLAETSTVDPDIASAAELAGRVWFEAPDPVRARAAFALALAQWTALGDTARATAIGPLAGGA